MKNILKGATAVGVLAVGVVSAIATIRALSTKKTFNKWANRWDEVEEASRESFPASDSPTYSGLQA